MLVLEHLLFAADAVQNYKLVISFLMTNETSVLPPTRNILFVNVDVSRYILVRISEE
jgi:hypothetical protein